jgi:predicted dithiol-disulfide oxidoreductase (DUF899 family)
MGDSVNEPMPVTAASAAPPIVDRTSFEAEIEKLRAREKALTRERDAIAAARRRLPMVEVDATVPLIGSTGQITLLDAFEGRTQLIAYYFMWFRGEPASDQCEGCTLFTSQLSEFSYLHSRDITYAVLCQGPYVRCDRGPASCPTRVRARDARP